MRPSHFAINKENNDSKLNPHFRAIWQHEKCLRVKKSRHLEIDSILIEAHCSFDWFLFSVYIYRFHRFFVISSLEIYCLMYRVNVQTKLTPVNKNKSIFTPKKGWLANVIALLIIKPFFFCLLGLFATFLMEKTYATLSHLDDLFLSALCPLLYRERKNVFFHLLILRTETTLTIIYFWKMVTLLTIVIYKKKIYFLRLL